MVNEIQEAGSAKATFFELLGGEVDGAIKIRALVEAFYDVMDTDPKAAPIRAMHAADLSSAREKLFMFLVGWTGGPQLYIERYGHPMLRKRHMPFCHRRIGPRSMDVLHDTGHAPAGHGRCLND